MEHWDFQKENHLEHQAFPDLGIPSFSASLNCTSKLCVLEGQSMVEDGAQSWESGSGPSWLDQKFFKESVNASSSHAAMLHHVATAGSVFRNQILAYTWAFHLWRTTDQLYTHPSLLGGPRSDMAHLQQWKL